MGNGKDVILLEVDVDTSNNAQVPCRYCRLINTFK